VKGEGGSDGFIVTGFIVTFLLDQAQQQAKLRERDKKNETAN
jgi:hypothetical protein